MDARIVTQPTVDRRGRLIRCGMAMAGVVAMFLAALPREAAAAAPVWRDGFDGETLDAAWYWHNENPDEWSLPGDGFLYIASSSFPTGGENLLLRSGAEGNFTIETHILFEPTVNYQIAGLVIYQDEANFLQLGRAYCEDEG
ncbi:MAG TPA: hypothetical protein VLL77_01440, partial [Anaerolineales bacterium]|nr:hypothetical protein [Anaerolineales bacterium]